MMNQSPYASLLAMMQNQSGPQGFTSPGTGMMPQLPPNMGPRGANASMPAIPSAFGANGQLPTQNQSQGFGGLMQNPQMLSALAGMIHPGAPPAGGGNMTPMPATLPSLQQQPGLFSQLMSMFGGQ